MLQELNEEYLLNLLDRLCFELEIRSSVHEYCDNDPWLKPMYIIPMWNIVEKLKKFEPYFDKFNIIFPTFDVYRQSINLETVFPSNIIHVREEEFIFKGEKIKIEYRYVL